jgi:hypothetical protein
MAPIRTLERISRQTEFADEEEARRYLSQQARDGFLPAAPYQDGIVPNHHHRDSGEFVTWTVHVEKQVYNGATTPGYREGDRVVTEIVGDPEWTPVEGTVREAHGHSLEVDLDQPNANGVRTVECQDYEVRPL